LTGGGGGVRSTPTHQGAFWSDRVNAPPWRQTI
jgi:hypothetical protein